MVKENMRNQAIFVILITLLISTSWGNEVPYELIASSDNTFNPECSQPDLKLNFSSAVISKIGVNFLNSSLITCLSFENNGIQDIAQNAFDQVPNLEYLNLAGNSISPAYLLAFGSHSNLQTLIIANQSNTYYNNYLRVVDKFPKLRYLNIENNRLTYVQNENNEEAFPALIYLSLAKNRFSNVDLSFVSRNLTYLSLEDNQIYSLDLTKFVNLRALNLRKNEISRLEYSSNVQLNRLRKLRYLSLAENTIRYIASETFSSMRELVFLNLSHNSLTKLPSGVFDSLSSLTYLNLDNNALDEAPILYTILNVSVLSMNNNRLTAIFKESFGGLLSLKQLYLNNNKIESVDRYAFRKLEKLEELHLANNNLTTLPNDWSSNLTSLKYLDLSANNFMYLESLSLDRSLPLLYIDLQGNELASLNARSFDDLPVNATVNLKTNLLQPWGSQREENMEFADY